tara:strand:- start:117 stop:347 length:231 start_codon:yes stop_codon:yes gene_type:complete
MEIKSLKKKLDDVQTSLNKNVSEKTFSKSELKTPRVDINVLRLKLQEIESKQFKKNIIILSTLVLTLGFLGIYLSF